jgi:hypothetical protein
MAPLIGHPQENPAVLLAAEECHSGLWRHADGVPGLHEQELGEIEYLVAGRRVRLRRRCCIRIHGPRASSTTTQCPSEEPRVRAPRESM